MTDFSTVVVSVSLSLIASIIITEYRLRRKQSVEESAEIEDWYSDTNSYAAEVRREWQRLFDTTESPNFSKLQSKMALLEGEISRHASRGEQLDVDKDVLKYLDDLAEQCHKISDSTVSIDSSSEFEEYRSKILDTVDSLEEELENF